MTNNQLTPERISDISDYFVEMQDHYSDPADRENFEIFRDAELLMKELQERRKAERGSEPVAIVEPSDYVTAAQLVGEGPVRKAVHELYEGALRIGDKLYRHAQPALVPDKMIYQDGVLFVLNNDMSSIERGTVAMRAWNACRAAMLQGAENAESRCGNSPVITGGLIAAVNRLLDSDGSRGCYSAIQCGDAHDEIERLLAAAPQELK